MDSGSIGKIFLRCTLVLVAFPVIWLLPISVKAALFMSGFLLIAWLSGFLWGREQMIDLYDSWLSSSSFKEFRKEKR